MPGIFKIECMFVVAPVWIWIHKGSNSHFYWQCCKSWSQNSNKGSLYGRLCGMSLFLARYTRVPFVYTSTSCPAQCLRFFPAAFWWVLMFCLPVVSLTVINISWFLVKKPQMKHIFHCSFGGDMALFEDNGKLFSAKTLGIWHDVQSFFHLKYALWPFNDVDYCNLSLLSLFG